MPSGLTGRFRPAPPSRRAGDTGTGQPSRTHRRCPQGEPESLKRGADEGGQAAGRVPVPVIDSNAVQDSRRAGAQVPPRTAFPRYKRVWRVSWWLGLVWSGVGVGSPSVVREVASLFGVVEGENTYIFIYI